MAARTTIADLEVLVVALTSRLDGASDYCKMLTNRIVDLEGQTTELNEQAVKTRKQLWYLQKRAKGEFGPQVPPKNGDTPPVDQVAQDEQRNDVAF